MIKFGSGYDLNNHRQAAKDVYSDLINNILRCVMDILSYLYIFSLRKIHKKGRGLEN